MDLIVNDIKTDLPAGLATWGDLLDWIETKHLKAGQCIIRVLLGNREEIHYRKPMLCGMGLEELGSIRIESGEFDAVVRESLAELEMELCNAVGTTKEIIYLLENRDQKAYSRLAHLLESMRTFYTLFSEDLGWVESDRAARAKQTATLENAIRQLISAQENRFWVSICDVLEYEITPVLENWLITVEKTRGRID